MSAGRLKRILLTGGSGFIGKNILASPLAWKYELISPSHSQLDLLDEDAVRKYVIDGAFDVIVHAAAKPGHRAAKDASALFYTNARIFCNLARMIDHASRIVLLGSGAIYDSRHYHACMKEEESVSHVPEDEHGFSKYVVEKCIGTDSRFLDLRLFGVFGRHEEYSIRFISNIICKALFDLPLTMHQNRRFSYLFVDDLSSILEHFIDHSPRYVAYNVTPDETWELTEIAELVRDIRGKELPIRIEHEGLGSEYSGSNARLRSEMRELRFTPMRKAVEKLYQWYEENIDMIDRQRLLYDR